MYSEIGKLEEREFLKDIQVTDSFVLKGIQQAVKKAPECTAPNCNENSVGDYNGHGAFFCERHMEKWNDYFDNEYK